MARLARAAMVSWVSSAVLGSEEQRSAKTSRALGARASGSCSWRATLPPHRRRTMILHCGHSTVVGWSRECPENVGVDGPRRHRVCQNEVVAVDLRQETVRGTD